MLSQALSVFDFLKIKYPDNTHRTAVYILPGLLSAVGVSLLVCLAYTHTETGNTNNILISEPVKDAFTLLTILPGFYIAALSAIAAINRPSIDELIQGKTPYLLKQELGRPQGEMYHQPLTRRLFLTLLFAYLASISLFLSLFLITVRLIYSFESFNIYAQLQTDLSIVIYGVLVFIFLFLIAQIFTLSLVGISYLGYRSMANN